MNNDYERLFDYFESPQPPAGLLTRIIRVIKKRERRSLRLRVIFLSVLLLASAASFLPSFQMVKSGLTESGFLKFFSLIFSDASIVMAHWKNFILSLLETLPVASLILFLFIALIFLESLKLLIRNIKNISGSKQLIINHQAYGYK